jgi:hypothetical protein
MSVPDYYTKENKNSHKKMNSLYYDDVRVKSPEAEASQLARGERGAGRPVDVRLAPTEAERRLAKQRSDQCIIVGGKRYF